MLNNNWIIFKNTNKLSQKLANDILSVAESSIKSKNSFKVVLAGGDSILQTYEILSNSKSDWGKWHIYMGDERCLPLKDKERNDHNINTVWLNNSSIPKKNIHFMHAELDAKQAVSHYETTLKEVKNFDLTLLSMGEDGHTASLFPGHFYNKNKSVVSECNSPKYPKNRISVSYSRLNKSKNIFKVVCGSSKKKAVDLWLAGKTLPINKIYGQSEKIFACENVL